MGDYLISFEPILMVLHYVAVLIVVVSILLQSGKGMNVGSVFGGGGSQSLFGARGAGNFLTKITTIAALVLLTTSLSLATVANKKARGNIGTSVISHDSVVKDTAPVSDADNKIDPNAAPVQETAKPENK